MQKAICKHCHKEIGQWIDPWGHPHWMHAPDDGPDAYRECKCRCLVCTTVDSGCIAGEEAEP